MQKEKKPQASYNVRINQKLKSNSFQVPSMQFAYFPFPPYPEQQTIIDTIRKAVKSSQNALIQSPTGTGKTLCLLIGAISSIKFLNLRHTKIFYLTRTHSQISQVVSELKKTPYVIKTNVIASRDHLCVNPNLRQMKGRVLERACNDLVNGKTCLFKEGDKQKYLKGKYEALALEDLKEQCKKQLVCPFYYSRDLTQTTELTILPFNYFLDWKIFQTFSHLIKNSIIIFDEAHNVDTIAEQGSNIQIDTKLLNFAYNELKQLEKRYKFESEENKKHKSEIKVACLILQSMKNSLECCKSKTFTSKSQVEEWMENSTTIIDPDNLLDTIDGLSLNDNMEFFHKLHQITKQFYKKQVPSSNFLNLIGNLQKICTLFKSQKFDQNFSIKISSDQGQKNFYLRLKCLSPSIGFEKIKQQSPCSIILSSGTLGNLENWQKYLNIQFHHKLSIEGFINQKQLFASIVTKSQSNYQFEFNFQKKDYENQHKQVAEELKKIQETIPNGNGIVVAFSTYLLMEKVIKFCGILKKRVFYESKGADVNRIFGEYSQKAKEEGAFLFIVMKGRFSQGINFSDYLCRCLIVVGIPFLPRKQVGIEQKMSYLRQTFSAEEADDWYLNQTFQAVNQTIGRVIRNKKDYGVILLLDQRYSKKDNFQLLSGWFKRCVRKFDSVQLYDQIKTFFKEQNWRKDDDDNSTMRKAQNSPLKTLEQMETKTIKMKKRHLKLRYDSEEKNRSSDGKSKQGSKSKSISKSKEQIQNKKGFSNEKSLQKSRKRKARKTSKKRQVYLTPQQSKNRKKMSSSASIVLSKINLEKKQKLKGFVNKKTNLNIQNNPNLSKIPNLRDIFEDLSEEYNNHQKSKDQQNSAEKSNQESRVSKNTQMRKKKEQQSMLEVNPYLEYFMM